MMTQSQMPKTSPFPTQPLGLAAVLGRSPDSIEADIAAFKPMDAIERRLAQQVVLLEAAQLQALRSLQTPHLPPMVAARLLGTVTSLQREVRATIGMLAQCQKDRRGARECDDRSRAATGPSRAVARPATRIDNAPPVSMDDVAADTGAALEAEGPATGVAGKGEPVGIPAARLPGWHDGLAATDAALTSGPAQRGVSSRVPGPDARAPATRAPGTYDVTYDSDAGRIARAEGVAHMRPAADGDPAHDGPAMAVRPGQTRIARLSQGVAVDVLSRFAAAPR